MEREQGEGFNPEKIDPRTGTVERSDAADMKKKAAEKADDWREQK